MRVGSFIDKPNSSFYKKDGSFNSTNLIPLAGNWIPNSAHVFLFTFAFKYAKISGINQGLISTITSFASIYNGIVFYFYFGEKLTCMKILGMCGMFLCVILLNIDASTKTGEADDGTSLKSYAFLAIGLAMIVPINFSIKHFLIRLYKGSYPTFELAIDSSILESLTFSIFAVWYHIEVGYGFWDYWLGALCGSLIISGKICMAIAISIGFAGPV
jgi:multidrug transporter EmrE-like cation transporter